MDPTVLAAALEPYRQHRRWCIAYSGGVDSHVLLHALAILARGRLCPPLAAVHVNHRIHPRADAWAEHCRAVCAALGIELRVLEVDVPRADGRGLEAAARAARYGAFERVLEAGDVLLQAHHRDDLAETVLLRLLRGAGMTGLAAMPAGRALGRAELFRPLLSATRAELVAYAALHGLRWIDDDSNEDQRFDRNFLRHRVLPRLEERWPAYRVTLARASAQAAQADELARALADIDLAAAGRLDVLDVRACAALSPARQRNLLRHWLRKRELPLPDSEQLEQLLVQLEAVSDAQVCVSWPGAQVRRFRDALYAMSPLPPLPEAVDQPWEPSQVLVIPGLGALRATPSETGGLRADRAYHVRNRRGGERCRPLGRAHSQTLKKLLQEADVPPWRRDRLPLVFCGEVLAAVADLWVCADFAVPAGQRGWALQWTAPA